MALSFSSAFLSFLLRLATTLALKKIYPNEQERTKIGGRQTALSCDMKYVMTRNKSHRMIFAWYQRKFPVINPILSFIMYAIPNGCFFGNITKGLTWWRVSQSTSAKINSFTRCQHWLSRFKMLPFEKRDTASMGEEERKREQTGERIGWKREENSEERRQERRD